MRVEGALLTLLNVPPETTMEYNRWYDFDHLPGHVSKPDVAGANRYVATRAMKSTPGAVASELTGGFPSYATVYLLGGSIDFLSEEAIAGWSDLDRRTVKAGRYWRTGKGTFNRRMRLTAAVARPSVLVDDAAIPHLPHTGVVVCIGRSASAERRPEAADWWSRIHLPDLLAVPGILAGMTFEPDDGDLLVHLLYCGLDPQEVMANVQAELRYLVGIGRYPAHGGVYETVARLPFQRIVPLRYDFDADDMTDDDVAPTSDTPAEEHPTTSTQAT
jgi:hypothetical protein